MVEENGVAALKELLNTRISALDQATNLRLQAAEQALILARDNLSLRLEHLNGAAQERDKLVASTLSRAEYDGKHEALKVALSSEIREAAMSCSAEVDKLSALHVSDMQKMETKIDAAAKGKVPWGVTIALTLFTAGIVGLLVAFLNHMGNYG